MTRKVSLQAASAHLVPPRLRGTRHHVHILHRQVRGGIGYNSGDALGARQPAAVSRYAALMDHVRAHPLARLYLYL